MVSPLLLLVIWWLLCYFICGVDADHCAFNWAFSQVSLVRDVPCGIQRRQPSGHRGSYVRNAAGCRVLTAVVSGVLLSTVMTFINDIIPREKSARIISFVYAGFSVASVLGTPIGTLLADAFGIKAAFIAVEAVALVVTVLLLVSVPRSGSTDVSSRVRDQLVILKDRASSWCSS